MQAAVAQPETSLYLRAHHLSCHARLPSRRKGAFARCGTGNRFHSGAPISSATPRTSNGSATKGTRCRSSGHTMAV